MFQESSYCLSYILAVVKTFWSFYYFPVGIYAHLLIFNCFLLVIWDWWSSDYWHILYICKWAGLEEDSMDGWITWTHGGALFCLCWCPCIMVLTFMYYFVHDMNPIFLKFCSGWSWLEMDYVFVGPSGLVVALCLLMGVWSLILSLFCRQNTRGYKSRTWFRKYYPNPRV